MRTRLWLLVTVLGLQTAWVVSTVAFQERALAGGTIILLETQPVDPRDLLRGDFVTLNYTISTVGLEKFVPPLTNAPPPGRAIYVLLEPQGEFHQVNRASLEPIRNIPDGQVVLHGTSTDFWAHDRVRIQYGLERYYVPEDSGNPQGRLTVQAAVSHSGKPVIKQVFLDGKPYAEQMRKQIQR